MSDWKKPSMSDKTYNVLFICTGNSARSVLSEAFLNRMGKGRFNAYSAGSFPTGVVNPLALRLLQDWDVPTEGLRSKSWGEFSGADAPPMDFVFTVCDRAAGEVCPVWPGQPILAHWGAPDPAAAEGTEQQRLKAFHDVGIALRRRIELFLSLPIAKLDALALTRAVSDIGKQ
jgi:protein-tyrosine-phosphatase